MNINKSTATFSTIVGIGEKIKKISKETGDEYIQLNRGVNAVVDIDLKPVIDMIDFNSKSLQVYAPNSGTEGFKNAVNREYFNSEGDVSNIFATPGGMPALDLIFQLLDVKRFYFPRFYWGSYSKVAIIRNAEIDLYHSLDDDIAPGSAVVVCFPSNPTGIEMNSEHLYNSIARLSNRGIIVIFDSPYRKMFKDDNLFLHLSMLENVIITESFSKSLGISGLRIGFIHSNNKELNEELNIRLLYEFNGVSTFSQIVVEKLLTTPAGMYVVADFKNETKKHIGLNIKYLSDNNLLTEEIYKDNSPLGIFAIINKSEEFLFQNKIGSVSLSKFTHDSIDKEKFKNDSRICVSVNHDQFVKFIKNVI